MKPLKDQVEEKLPWLFSQLGFRIASYSYNPAVFEDSTVVLDSDAFRLRLIRDKGFVTASVAAVSDPEHWLEFKFVWEMIFGELPAPTLEGYGPLIREGFNAFAEALGPNYSQTKEMYDQRAKERRKRWEEHLARGPKMFGPAPTTVVGKILTNPLGWVLLTLILWLIWSAKRPS
jgi:hypothetical protein